MKTAVEWLKEQYDSCPPYEPFLGESEWEQAKAMEKEQIKDAWINSLTKGDYNSAEEYYNKTFKSE